MSGTKNRLQGRKKGGTQFPRIPLARALEYARKLVSKTHTGPQPATIILKGVFDNAGSEGKIRASALKQFGLLTGPSSAYSASELAKRINSAPKEELKPMLQQAVCDPDLFKTLYTTFQNDTVTRPKIRQQALKLKVHPDSADQAVEIFVESLVHAGLAVETGADIELGPAAVPLALDSESETDEANRSENETSEAGEAGSQGEGTGGSGGGHVKTSGPIHVNLSVDSTMDPDKLEKSLTLLRKYGVI